MQERGWLGLRPGRPVTPQGLRSVPLEALHSWEGHGTAAKRTCLRTRVWKGVDTRELTRETRGPLLDLQPATQSKPGRDGPQLALHLSAPGHAGDGGAAQLFLLSPPRETPPTRRAAVRNSRGPHLNVFSLLLSPSTTGLCPPAPGCRVLSVRQTNQPVGGRRSPPPRHSAAAPSPGSVLCSRLPAERWLCRGSRGDIGKGRVGALGGPIHPCQGAGPPAVCTPGARPEASVEL